MDVNLFTPKNINHLVLLVIEVIFFGLILNYKCIGCYEKYTGSFQFVTFTAGGHALLMLVICLGIFFSEEFERKTLLSGLYLAVFYHLLSFITLLAELHKEDAIDARIATAAAFSILVAVLYLAEAIVLSCCRRKYDID